jgi:hypothetical protein
MAFDWLLWLDLADELIAQRNDEAHSRCAASRAYYVVFNLSRAWLLDANRIGDGRESPHFVV